VPRLLAFLEKDKKFPAARCEGKVDYALIASGKAGCLLGNAEVSPNFIIIGDSHGRMWADGLDALAKGYGTAGMALTFSSCAPLSGVEISKKRPCRKINAAVLKYLLGDSPQNVILAGFWVNTSKEATVLNDIDTSLGRSAFYLGMDGILQDLNRAGKNIYVMLDIPFLRSNNQATDKVIESFRNQNRATFGKTLSAHRNYNSEVDADIFSLQKKYGFTVLDPAIHICSDKQGCMAANEGRILYYDSNHLTDRGAYFFRNVFLPMFLDSPVATHAKNE